MVRKHAKITNIQKCSCSALRSPAFWKWRFIFVLVPALLFRALYQEIRRKHRLVAGLPGN
jgi:hypothetical protein